MPLSVNRATKRFTCYSRFLDCKNDIEKGFKSNLISYNILYNLMHCCLCFSFLCDVSLLFIFYHSPYDFNVTYDFLIKKLKLSKQNFSLIVAIFCPEIITKTSNYRFLEVIKTLFSLIFQTFSTLNSIRGLIVGQRLLQQRTQSFKQYNVSVKPKSPGFVVAAVS